MKKFFFNIADLTREEITAILDQNETSKCLQDKSIGLIFEKYSTRTRLSFAVGISSLGGNAININFQDLNISRDETFEDTFLAMNCYLDGLVYRTNNHKKLLQASKFFEKPIINALSDISHPCQILGDLLTLKENFGSLNSHILWIGDVNNVCFSLFEAAKLFEEIRLIICSPLSLTKQINWEPSHNISFINSLDFVDLSSVNCVMTDVFISMNDEENEKKKELLRPYTVNSNLMNRTASNSIFMHCLPAKVGLEVSEEVFRSSRSIVWRQAYNRMIAQKKLLHLMYR